mgnify:CR=1 FL=1|tara:strand:- start:58252 stop:59040 length:789 start_codon:yes stop_codon:yes gene_type:complete
MAPNKLENNLKKTLEAREIQPSYNAWNQLSNSLDIQDKKSSKKYIWFLGIAASIVGLLFVVNTLQPFQEIESIPMPTVVTTDSDKNLKIENISKGTNAVNNTEVSVTNSEEENVPLIDPKVTTDSPKNRTSTSKNTSETRYALVENNETQTVSPNNIENLQNGKIESKALNNLTSEYVIANNDGINSYSNSALNSEVDALLKQAKSKVSTITTSEKTHYKINPNSLLEDVETDLEISFRDKVFESIKTNFTIVKTAVADRNN